MDVQGDLAVAALKVAQGDFAIDIEFQEYMQVIFQKTIDAHTRYSKPVCYNAIFVQPLAFDMRVEENSNSLDNEPKVYLMKNLYTDIYADIYPDVDLSPLIDQQVTLLNGVEFTTEVSSWGDTHETKSNNRGVRFNAAIRSYMYRNAISINVLPVADLTITLADGSSHTLPWMVSYTNGLANVSYCAALPSTPMVNSPLSRTTVDDMEMDTVSPKRLEHAPLHASRPDREVIVPTNSPYYISCFVQTVGGDYAETAGISRVLVMKVASFSPPGYYLDAWAGFLDEAQQCLSVEFDMIVVDVMQNGGGYVCLGLRLIELLVEEYEDDHTLVQMNYDLVHSKLMDRYIDVVNAPNPYPDPQDVEQILDRATQESFPDGRAYYYPGRNVTMGGKVSWRTNFFSLDCREAEAMPSNGFRPPKFMTPDKLIILTDGTCGSTCASFAKIPQEDSKATLVGAGGLWDEGMDVASFAGGFVCNPTYLYNIANWSKTTFPVFATNQRWQFAWALWYSAKLPSRPIQFTSQDPDYREAFWGFPHVSIDSTVTTEMVSVLYDRVIASTIVRLADAVVPSQSCSSSSGNGLSSLEITLSVIIAILGATLLLMAVMFALARYRKRSTHEDNFVQNIEQNLKSNLIA